MQELKELLREEKLHGVPLLVFANKQDLLEAAAPDQVLGKCQHVCVCVPVIGHQHSCEGSNCEEKHEQEVCCMVVLTVAAVWRKQVFPQVDSLLTCPCMELHMKSPSKRFIVIIANFSERERESERDCFL